MFLRIPLATSLVALALASPSWAAPLTFSEALDRAVAEALSLQAKALQVQASQSAARSAGALPDPKLTFGVENFPVSGPPAGRFGEDEMTMARVGVMLEVPNGARRRAQAAMASAEVGSARAQLALETRNVRLAAALAWLELAYAERRLAALDQIVAGLAGIWEALPSAVASGTARPAAGIAPKRARAQFEDMRSELVAAAAKARAQLARWTGETAPSTVGDPPHFQIDPAALRAALDRNPALLGYQAATRRAEADADAARAAKRPDWSFEVAYGRRDPMFGDMVSVGATVSLPIFARSRQEPVIAARLADVKRTRVEREDARRALAAALEGDLADHAMHHEQWMRSLQVLVPSAEQRAHLELESYAAGRADLEDVMEAATGLAEAKLQALEREALVGRDGARIVLTNGGEL